ncbi:MAG TPA: NINE protein [Bacilli bacterium]|nr:NINE protein [Bacilli bacterium]
MAQNSKFDVVLLLIAIFLGWFGIDKLYKGDVKMFIIKLLLNIIIVGAIWNIVDIVMILLGKYQIDPRKYL